MATISIEQKVIEIMGTPPPDTSGIAEEIDIRHPDPEKRFSMYYGLYHSGRIDMAVFMDGKPYECLDFKDKNWEDLTAITTQLVNEEGWVRGR